MRARVQAEAETVHWARIGGEAIFPCLADPEIRWNGWLGCPWFCPETVEQILGWLGEDSLIEWGWEVRDGQRVLKLVNHDYVDPARPESLDEATEWLEPRDDGRYSLGAFGWTWEAIHGNPRATNLIPREG